MPVRFLETNFHPLSPSPLWLVNIFRLLRRSGMTQSSTVDTSFLPEYPLSSLFIPYSPPLMRLQVFDGTLAGAGPSAASTKPRTLASSPAQVLRVRFQLSEIVSNVALSRHPMIRGIVYILHDPNVWWCTE